MSPRLTSAFASSLVLLLISASAVGQVEPALYGSLKWREIGPFRGGRSNAVHGVQGQPDVYYMGTCGGGLWKTTNSGVDWECVSDGYFKTGSVGAIGVSTSAPDTVYVGMGETELRGNISHGDGMYKTSDAGKTWSHIGLEETRHIARVRVHPTDPNTVWVAALGHAYGPNTERGVFKTTDGGTTWKRVLYVSERAGAIDLCVDPNDPNVLFASMWEAFRTPYSLSSGGAGSGLYRSQDGGETWSDVSRSPGLPKGLLGKIGVSVSAVDSKRVYAIVEAEDGGVFSSDDGGATWTLTSDDRNYRQRAFYYTRIYADTKDKDTVYVLNVGFGKSTDGGKKFASVRVPHSDNHDLWISADDPLVMVNANDGGGNVTKDGGKTWTNQDFATAQFYHVTTDNALPYRIYGAQQDNSTIRIASRAGGGISSQHWESTAGGESGYVAVKPDDPEVVVGANYSGYIEIRDHKTGLSRDVNPWPDNPLGRGAIELGQRMQWTFPILFSPHDPGVLYACSQYVLKSTDMGASWKKISPDLTRNDPATLQPSGGPITKDNTGVEIYATIFTLAESPIKKGLLWAGSDDGLVHVSQNGGKKWTAVTPTGMPKWGLCSMIEASAHRAGTAYLAVDNHESDDFAPYVYVTDDFGASWRLAVNGLPKDSFVRVVREDPEVPGLLFAGTETGAYVSFDGGGLWAPLQNGLPVVPIHDLTVKSGDLIAATHGRSFWVLDDLSPLRQAQKIGVSHKPVLYRPRDASRAQFRGGFGGRRQAQGEREPAGANPPSGVIVDYYLPADAKTVTVEYLDSRGTVVAKSEPGKTKGAHRTSQFLQYPSFVHPKGLVMWDGSPSPIKAPPGTYTVRLTVDDMRLEQTFRWSGDPRSPATDKDLQEQFEFSKTIAVRVTEANTLLEDAMSVVRQIDDVKSRHPEAETQPLRDAMQGIVEAIYQTRAKAGQDLLNYPVRLNNRLATLFGSVQGGEFGPTKQTYEVYEVLSRLLDEQLAQFEGLVTNDLAALNAALEKFGEPKIDPKKRPEPPKEQGGLAH